MSAENRSNITPALGAQTPSVEGVDKDQLRKLTSVSLDDKLDEVKSSKGWGGSAVRR